MIQILAIFYTKVLQGHIPFLKTFINCLYFSKRSFLDISRFIDCDFFPILYALGYTEQSQMLKKDCIETLFAI